MSVDVYYPLITVQQAITHCIGLGRDASDRGDHWEEDTMFQISYMLQQYKESTEGDETE